MLHIPNLIQLSLPLGNNNEHFADIKQSLMRFNICKTDRKQHNSTIVVNFAALSILKTHYTRFRLNGTSFNICGKAVMVLMLVMLGVGAIAQPSNVQMPAQWDTSDNKTNDGKWKNQSAVTTFQKLNSARIYKPDTGIHTFHRRPFIQPWVMDQGNPGSPTNNLLFSPTNKVGPTFGYYSFDQYRFKVDSLNYYSTTNPYSDFCYQTAGRQENIASILHTQNIRPNWNFALQYRKISSTGYYKIQRNNLDNFFLSSNYKSIDKHYRLNFGMVYNKQQHDENGGFIDTFLSNPAYSTRKTIQTLYESSSYSTSRSSVSNMQRDFSVLLQQRYTWGATDTVFNKQDTSAYTYDLTPRFSITHKLTMGTEKHAYKDLTPDSMRYLSLFNESFANDGTGYYSAGGDSVYTGQKWFWADNKLLLDGYIGKAGRQLKFSAGAGIRYDQFISDPVTKLIPDTPFTRIGYDRRSSATTYIEGQIKKEALTDGAWGYGAASRFITTGPYAGNFSLNAVIGKQLKNNLANFTAGFKQQLGSAPYAYSTYQNIYTNTAFNINPESITTLYATLESSKLKLSGGARGNVIDNYIYIGTQELPTQYANSFVIPQFWLRKVFKFGNFYLDNEIVYQIADSSLPVNVPAVMGRHQFSFEKGLFKNAITIATGIQARYNTAYKPAGYTALFNNYFYQNNYYVGNLPDFSVFFNFRIKRFRAFLMGDNLQQIFARNTILYTGSPYINRTTGAATTTVYAKPNFLFRFGFNWVMIN